MIKIENIGRVFNPRSRNRNQVLKGVSFELPQKGLVALFGKSGSGKTTMLNIIGGLDRQDSGKIYIDGECTSGKVDRIRNAKIGFIFQNYYLEKGYTISEIMRNQMMIAGFKDEAEIARRTSAVLQLVEMERYKNKQGDALSGGQKQRVAIARALIKGADVILADEPTGNLDVQNTIKVMDILKEISKTKLVVLVTHEITLIKRYADSYIELVDGEISNTSTITENVRYDVERNNIYADESTAREVRQDGLGITLYGDPIQTESDLQIFNDGGTVYLKVGKSVSIIDDASEKKVVFKGNAASDTAAEEKAPVPVFEKTKSKRNGKLFNFKRVFGLFRRDSEERFYSTSNVFKQIFICAIAAVICFFAFNVFEIANMTIENKSVNENSIYTSLNAYSELRRMDESKYESIDFFDTHMLTGSFSYSDMAALANIEADYTPKAINTGDTFEGLYGKMPEVGEILISRALAEKLKTEFRMEELSNDKSLLLVSFDNTFKISGIVDGGESFVYMNKSDYVNFLGVFASMNFSDTNGLFFKDNYGAKNYTVEIRLAEKELANDKVLVEINRNSLYKMMVDSTQADYEVELTNTQLAHTPYAIQITNSKMYVEKFEITRDVMTTDIRIYVNSEVLDNIFVYMSPNLDALGTRTAANGMQSAYYFEIETADSAQLTQLKNELRDRGVTSVDINAIYERENTEILEESREGLNIFYVMIVLLLLIYYFIEKSGSIKNSKEYGIYRAIGVNKSNLLFKECIATLVSNIIGYLVCFAVVTTIICIRYAVMNVVFTGFVGIALAMFGISAALMVAISMIPYTFVLYQTPAKILTKFDI